MTSKVLKQRVLDHLRFLFEEEPGDPTLCWENTFEIGEALDISEDLLWSPDGDAGILWELQQEGKVLSEDTGRDTRWCARGARVRVKWD